MDVPVADPSAVTCAAASCTKSECCVSRTCCNEADPVGQSTVTCTQGRIEKSNVCSSTCGPSCDEIVCCDNTCSSWLTSNSCSGGGSGGGSTQEANVASLLCKDNTGGSCDQSYCCESPANPTCAADPPTCDADQVPVASPSGVTCAGASCTKSECCTARTCCNGADPIGQSTVTCTQGRTEKSGVCGLSCGAACDETDCCDNSCSTWVNEGSGCAGG